MNSKFAQLKFSFHTSASHSLFLIFFSSQIRFKNVFLPQYQFEHFFTHQFRNISHFEWVLKTTSPQHQFWNIFNLKNNFQVPPPVSYLILFYEIFSPQNDSSNFFNLKTKFSHVKKYFSPASKKPIMKIWIKNYF